MDETDFADLALGTHASIERWDSAVVRSRLNDLLRKLGGALLATSIRQRMNFALDFSFLRPRTESSSTLLSRGSSVGQVVLQSKDIGTFLQGTYVSSCINVTPRKPWSHTLKRRKNLSIVEAFDIQPANALSGKPYVEAAFTQTLAAASQPPEPPRSNSDLPTGQGSSMRTKKHEHLSAGPPERLLQLLITSPKHGSVWQSIDCRSLNSDSEFFHNLRKAYERQHSQDYGLLRRFLDCTQVTGCDFVKVRRPSC